MFVRSFSIVLCVPCGSFRLFIFIIFSLSCSLFSSEKTAGKRPIVKMEKTGYDKTHSWERDANLLAEVERHPFLYDRTQEQFTNYDLRRHVWQEIADNLGMDENSAKTRYRHLRDSFIKRLRKEKLHASCDKRPPAMHRFSSNLQFLVPFITISDPNEVKERTSTRAQKARKRKGSLSEEDDTDELLGAVSVMVEDEDGEEHHFSQNEPSDDIEDEFEYKSTIPTATQILTPSAKIRRLPDQNGDSNMIEYLVPNDSAPREDELDTFFKTISTTMRKLPPVLQSKLKFRIMEIVYKAEEGHLLNEENTVIKTEVQI